MAGIVAATLAATTQAYTVNLTPAAPKTIYLQIGVGAFTGGNYLSNGQPARNAFVNTVSANIAAAVVGNGTAQTMTTDSTAANSFYDSFPFCSLPNQLYIGGFYRTTGAVTGAAQVIASVPLSLTDATGDTIPFTQIKWSAGGNGPTGTTATQPFPSGAFTGVATQNVGAIASNQWAESCWTFSYLNTAVPAGGTYTGVVTYTLTSP